MTWPAEEQEVVYRNREYGRSHSVWNFSLHVLSHPCFQNSNMFLGSLLVRNRGKNLINRIFIGQPEM